jgi:hypothetical protein
MVMAGMQTIRTGITAPEIVKPAMKRVALYNVNANTVKHKVILKRKYLMNNKLLCHCCGYRTIDNDWDICPVCFWEKDPMQEKFVFSCTGANHVCLMIAQDNYQKFGACEEAAIRYVRKPLTSEI